MFTAEVRSTHWDRAVEKCILVIVSAVTQQHLQPHINHCFTHSFATSQLSATKPNISQKKEVTDKVPYQESQKNSSSLIKLGNRTSPPAGVMQVLQQKVSSGSNLTQTGLHQDLTSSSSSYPPTVIILMTQHWPSDMHQCKPQTSNAKTRRADSLLSLVE